MKDIQTSDIWLTKKVYDDAETAHYENLYKNSITPLAGEVAKARQRLIESRDNFTSALSTAPAVDLNAFKFIESKVQEFQSTLDNILEKLTILDDRVSVIEKSANLAKPMHEIKVSSAPPAKPAAPASAADDDDDVDLFGSDSDDAEIEKIREERLAAYHAKKAKKPVLIAKSNVILDIKPWDDETDMKAMEENVRKIECEGLLWGAAKLVPLAYGIHKLQISCVVEDEKVSIDWLMEQISCVVEDEKVSIDWLMEQIENIEDYVQSVDIAAFNKI